MSAADRVRRWLRLPDSDSRMHREIDDELRFHLDSRIDDLVARGLSPQDAERIARRELGDLREAHDAIATVDAHRLTSRRWRTRLEELAGDVRLALRAIVREKAFTAAVALTLAIGIGANAVMFGIVDRLLFRAPPHVANAESIRRVGVTGRWLDGEEYVSMQRAFPTMTDIERESRTLEHAAGQWRSSRSLGSGRDAREVDALAATASLFTLAGAHPALGRFYGNDEDRPGGANAVAVLSYGMWQRDFAGARDVLGKPLLIDGDPVTIVGVAPRGFRGFGTERVELFLPMSWVAPKAIARDYVTQRGFYFMEIFARLRPGHTDAAAAAEVTTIVRRHAEKGDSDEKGNGIVWSIIPGRASQLSADMRVAFWLQGVAVLLLAIACANATNLMFTRSSRRARELAVRVSLGAGRARLVRWLLVEGIVFAGVATILALMISRWGGDAARSLLLYDFATDDRFIDGRVVLATVGVALVAALASSLAPALAAGRSPVAQSLRAGSKGLGYRRSKLRVSLIALQAALSLVLVAGSALFVRSFQKATATDLGFDADRVASLYLNASPIKLKGDSLERFLEEGRRQLQRVPGVASVSRASAVPFSSSRAVGFRVEGIDSLPRYPDGGPYVNLVSDDYFTTMGIRMVAGRAFEPTDMRGAPMVAVVTEAFEKTIFHGAPAIGRCLYVSEKSTDCRRIVGVSRNSRRQSLRDDAALQYYLPTAQGEGLDFNAQSYMVRVKGGDPQPIIRAAALELQSMRGDVPAVSGQLLFSLLDWQLRPYKLGASLFSVFAVLALLVAGLGLYGVVSFDAAQRQQEIGVRVALGATARDIVRLVMLGGMRGVAVGVAIGLVLVLAIGGVLSKLLFDVSGRDPVLIGGAALILLLVASAASLIPGLRTARTSPADALRAE